VAYNRPMTGSGDFNVTAAGALVVGGIAALLLATAVTLGGYGRKPSIAAEPMRQAAGGAPTEAEIEYLLETSEPQR
jgi:hypothetical protein